MILLSLAACGEEQIAPPVDTPVPAEPAAGKVSFPTTEPTTEAQPAATHAPADTPTPTQTSAPTTASGADGDSDPYSYAHTYVLSHRHATAYRSFPGNRGADASDIHRRHSGSSRNGPNDGRIRPEGRKGPGTVAILRSLGGVGVGRCSHRCQGWKHKWLTRAGPWRRTSRCESPRGPRAASEPCTRYRRTADFGQNPARP